MLRRQFGLVGKRLFCSRADPIIINKMYTDITSEFKRGNLESSVYLCMKAIEEASKESKIYWKELAAFQLNLGHIFKLQCKFKDALEISEEGLKTLDSHYSSAKLEVCHALDVVAELACELSEYKRAHEVIDRSIGIKSGMQGPSDISLAKTYNIRGTVNLNEGSSAQARSDFIRALAINVQHFGTNRPLAMPIGITLSNLVNALSREDTFDISQGVALYREVVASFEAVEQDSWLTGSALTDLADALISSKTGKGIDEAKELLMRALHIFMTTRGLDHPSTDRAASLLKATASASFEVDELIEDIDFVDTLIKECENVLPKKQTRVSGDIVFLDKRGHVGHGHPHTPLC
jgi:tetratricopeptide (TPR) repeat protein